MWNHLYLHIFPPSPHHFNLSSVNRRGDTWGRRRKAIGGTLTVPDSSCGRGREEPLTKQLVHSYFPFFNIVLVFWIEGPPL